MPTPRRMSTPGYGFEDVKQPGAKLAWDQVSRLIADARTYWIATVRPDGRPHIAPIWGVWTDDTFVFETLEGSVKGRNLLANPACAVHIDHTEAGVMIEGRAERTRDQAKIDAFEAAYLPKYKRDVQQYLDRPDSAVFIVRPRVAFSFREFLGQTVTRWEF